MTGATLPGGIVTFLFTDIEGSTRLIEELGEDGYVEALAQHRRTLREAFAGHGGVEVDTQGDAFFFVFSDPVQALAAAAQGQEALASGPVRVRMGLHTGNVQLTGEGYAGRELHRAARIAASGHGGQVVVSAATRGLVDGSDLSELGEHRLKDFPEPVALFQLGDERFAPLKTISNTNLPRPASSFVGRQREREELVSMLSNGRRLVTLSGPGGSGKTRLALEVASELVPAFKAGVFWVGLSALRDPALVTAEIARTLGAKDGLADYVGERELMLLLDNFEQVVEAAPGLGDLLESCPNLKVMVTSRELLSIRGEVDYPVPPLVEAEAVELFCTRTGLAPDEKVAELCRQLDNLPLAVELAAARTSVLSPAQVLERLSQRLDMLRGGRDADPRQQTLRATIEWSHDLLAPVEQRLFARLAVFRGGCRLEAAEQVAEADLDTLQSLADKSLLRHADERFWMLETIREYASERLTASGEEAELRGRHALVFLDFAEAVTTGLEQGTEESVEFERINVEHDNLRAALEWADDRREYEIVLRLAAALQGYWLTRGFYRDVDTWLPLALEKASSPVQARMAVLRGAHMRAAETGDSRSAALAAEWRSLAEQAGDEPQLLLAMNYVALNTAWAGDFDSARKLWFTIADRARALGDRTMEGRAEFNLGYVDYLAGDYQAGLEHAAKAVELDRQERSEFSVATALGLCGSQSLGLSDPASAAAYFRDSLVILTRIGGTRTHVAVLVLAGLGAALVGLREAERGAQVLAAAAYLRDERGTSFDDEKEEQTVEQAVAAARAALGEVGFAAAWARGEAMTPEEIIASTMPG